MANRKKIIAIVGPTASGKTALAVKIAQEFNGEIVSADSRQVYRGLDLGTGKEGEPEAKAKSKRQKAKPQVKTQKLKEIEKDLRYIKGIPQWMIDVAEPEERFTLFDWLKAARLVIGDIFERGKVPVVVGGTGLYVQGLIEGYALKSQKEKGKRKNHNVKVKSFQREELEKFPREKLVRILRRLNSEKLETVDQKNPRRLIRAIEIAQEGDRVGKTKPDFEILQIAIFLPRHELYKKINRRVEKRFEQGMLEEVKRLLARGIDPKWLIGLGLEYKIITTYLINKAKGETRKEKPQGKSKKSHGRGKTFEEMEQELKYKSHGYARRQLTWSRRFPEIKWVQDSQEVEKLVATFLKVGKR